MQYQVDVEFTRPKRKFLPLFSWLVRLVERTPYSHVRITWTSSSGEPLIYEASGASVRLIGRYASKSHEVEVLESYTFNLDATQYKRLIGLFRFAGVRYGTLQIIGIALARWLKLSKNPLSKGSKQQVCSELVAYFLSDVLGLPMREADYDLVGPRAIKEKLDELCTSDIQFDAGAKIYVAGNREFH